MITFLKGRCRCARNARNTWLLSVVMSLDILVVLHNTHCVRTDRKELFLYFFFQAKSATVAIDVVLHQSSSLQKKSKGDCKLSN